MKRVIALTVFTISLTETRAALDFTIVINRTNLNGNYLRGTISVNGQIIGSTLENDEYRIPPGRYPGALRYLSHRNFVQNPNGEMFYTGDFLLEIAGVKDWKGRTRTDILFHGGSKPINSEGCILLGSVGKPTNGVPTISPDHPLYKLRLAFYGTDTPAASPNKTITIEIIDKIERKQPEEKRKQPEEIARGPYIGKWSQYVWYMPYTLVIPAKGNGTLSYIKSRQPLNILVTVQVVGGKLVLGFPQGWSSGWTCSIVGGRLQCDAGPGKYIDPFTR